MNQSAQFPFITDFSTYESAYQKWYAKQIRKEQIRLVRLLKHKYSKTKLDSRLVIIYEPDGDFGDRDVKKYKVVIVDTPLYNELVTFGKYQIICNFNEIIAFYKLR